MESERNLCDIWNFDDESDPDPMGLFSKTTQATDANAGETNGSGLTQTSTWSPAIMTQAGLLSPPVSPDEQYPLPPQPSLLSPEMAGQPGTATGPSLGTTQNAPAAMDSIVVATAATPARQVLKTTSPPSDSRPDTSLDKLQSAHRGAPPSHNAPAEALPGSSKPVFPPRATGPVRQRPIFVAPTGQSPVANAGNDSTAIAMANTTTADGYPPRSQPPAKTRKRRSARGAPLPSGGHLVPANPLRPPFPEVSYPDLLHLKPRDLQPDAVDLALGQYNSGWTPEHFVQHERCGRTAVPFIPHQALPPPLRAQTTRPVTPPFAAANSPGAFFGYPCAGSRVNSRLLYTLGASPRPYADPVHDGFKTNVHALPALSAEKANVYRDVGSPSAFKEKRRMLKGAIKMGEYSRAGLDKWREGQLDLGEAMAADGVPALTRREAKDLLEATIQKPPFARHVKRRRVEEEAGEPSKRVRVEASDSVPRPARAPAPASTPVLVPDPSLASVFAPTRISAPTRVVDPAGAEMDVAMAGVETTTSVPTNGNLTANEGARDSIVVATGSVAGGNYQLV